MRKIVYGVHELNFVGIGGTVVIDFDRFVIGCFQDQLDAEVTKSSNPLTMNSRGVMPVLMGL